MSVSYDSWLEEPYQRMYAEGDAYLDWCERNDVLPCREQWKRYQQELKEWDE